MLGENGNCETYEYEIFSFFKSKRQEQFRPLILSLIHQKELGNITEKMYIQALEFVYNFFICFTIIEARALRRRMRRNDNLP